jgi:hypothetical protein
MAFAGEYDMKANKFKIVVLCGVLCIAISASCAAYAGTHISARNTPRTMANENLITPSSLGDSYKMIAAGTYADILEEPFAGTNNHNILTVTAGMLLTFALAGAGGVGLGVYAFTR